MNNLEHGPANMPGQSAPVARSGRVRRVVTTVAAGAILLGSGVAIGLTLTSGATAATTPPVGGAAGPLAGKCAKIVQDLRSHPAFAKSHPTLVARVRAYCGNPLLRLAAVGGEYGQVTFQTKSGPKTAAFERGTIDSVTGSSFVVQAPDGTKETWTITATTKMREIGNPQAKAQLTTGDQVLVIGQQTASGRDARLIGIHQAS
jgi:Domain of unknown function (DUF5666)